MDVVFLIGRSVAAVMYLFLGLGHFMRMKDMIGDARMKKAPVPTLAVPLTGLALMVGAVSIGLGFMPTVGVVAVVAVLVLKALIMHQPRSGADQLVKQNEMVNFMKNMAMAGTTLMLLVIPQPWPLSIGS